MHALHAQIQSLASHFHSLITQACLSPEGRHLGSQDLGCKLQSGLVCVKSEKGEQGRSCPGGLCETRCSHSPQEVAAHRRRWG